MDLDDESRRRDCRYFEGGRASAVRAKDRSGRACVGQDGDG